jgi:hypothetical protein
MSIHISVEGRRGCGYRKAGGLYLACDGEGRFCGALPIPLTVCPTCNCGIKPARGFTWIDLATIRGSKPCIQDKGPNYCDSCAFFSIGRAGLIWVGEVYYKTPHHFDKEAATMGISRRISAVPNGFRVGETWIALAHRRAIQTPFVLGEDPVFTAGIFKLFVPTSIDYIIRKSDTKEQLDEIEKRGIRLVRVIRKGEKEAA